MDWQIIAALGSVGGFALSFALFWFTFGSRLSKAEISASSALDEAKEANEKTNIISASFALYREQIARDYVSRDVMREFEERLTKAIDGIGTRMDRLFENRSH